MFTNIFLSNSFLASLTVVMGDHDVTNDYEPSDPVERNVKRVVVHRGYIARTFDNDLALLELDKPVKFQEHILPICLPEGDDDFVGEVATVTGWGRLRHGKSKAVNKTNICSTLKDNSKIYGLCKVFENKKGYPFKINITFKLIKINSFQNQNFVRQSLLHI